jgi:hypothetical protein
MPERHTAAPATDQTNNRMPEIEQERKSWLDLSPIQVMGGALAAMTAAGLGSRFSVEGTVLGAAIASVIAAVAGALYTASLRRTGEAVRGVLGARRTVASQIMRPSTGSTAVAPESLSGPAGTADTSARTSRRRTLVLSSVVGAVAIFALAGGALTMYEAIAGQALSGGGGTTFSQVQQDEREDQSEDQPRDEQDSAPNESADPGESADPTSTAKSSDSPEPQSAPTEEPSADPSVEPSAESSVTAEAEPRATAAHPREAPSQPAQTPR